VNSNARKKIGMVFVFIFGFSYFFVNLMFLQLPDQLKRTIIQPMYQKDYILRMIEMLGEILRAIFGKINRGQFEEAQQNIHDAYLTMLRKDSAFFQQIPEDKLTTLLIEEHNYTNAHLEILAELLYAEATWLHVRNKVSESLPYYQKSLRLFEFVDKAYRTYSQERLGKMEEIRKEILEILHH
jgi:hypothetical protein